MVHGQQIIGISIFIKYIWVLLIIFLYVEGQLYLLSHYPHYRFIFRCALSF